MTYKRSPSAHYSTTGEPIMLPSPNALHGRPVCATCRWPAECRGEGLCWAGEKRDIAAEQAAGYGSGRARA